MLESVHDAQVEDGEPDSERHVKIEELLLAGLDHYFKGRYEGAIDVWSRVLFLDRSHARARAYINRARAALAEKLRQSEELVHTGVEAFERGDVHEARSLLTSAIEQGGGRDEALTILERLDRLEAASGSTISPSDAHAQDSGGAGERRPRTRPGALPLMLVMGVIGAVLYLAVLQGAWEVLDGAEATTPLSRAEARSLEPLPVPSEGNLALARARRLAADGRWRAALDALERVELHGDEARAMDVLRADLQRRVLAAVDDAPSGAAGITVR